MLIQFAFENYRSFSAPSVLSMKATRDKSHPNHLISGGLGKESNVLRLAALFGHNASGKSNFITAIGFARRLIVLGGELSLIPFRLGKTPNPDSRFQFDFVAQGVKYTYGFVIDSERIREEFLYGSPNGRERVYFERTLGANGKSEADFGDILAKHSRESHALLRYKMADTRPNQLLLNAIFEGNLGNELDPLVPVWEWFGKSLGVITADAEPKYLEILLQRDAGLRQELRDYLQYCNLGIENTTIEEKPFDWNIDLFPTSYLPPLLQKLPDVALNELEPGQASFFPSIMGKRGVVYRRESGEVMHLKLALHHSREDGNLEPFDLEDESDGTRRLLELFPALYGMRERKETVLIIDELDRKLHTLLSKFFIQSVIAASTTSQLLFTTHDTNLLDQELLRRDEIWFVEKDREGASHLYSLAEFKIRPDLELEKGYLNGRFGAIPNLSSLSLLQDPQEVAHA